LIPKLRLVFNETISEDYRDNWLIGVLKGWMCGGK